MEKLFKNSKRWMTALGVVVFLMVAGWQVGADGTQEVFVETEVALENAKAGSDLSCKVEVIDCSSGGTRQICHKNGEGVSCLCGDSTEC
jgi:1,4-dihydroxy-2-naphthoyl-CoA synthase